MQHSQVKTRMQLETGKSKHGLVGAFRNIVKEEGYGSQSEFKADSRLMKESGLDDFTEVTACVIGGKYVIESVTRIGPSFIARGTQTCRQIVRTLNNLYIPDLILF